MIQVQNLTVRYGAAPVVKDVSLHLPAGSFTLLTGPSGCGKTTLARAITGVIPHALPAQINGRVLVDGLDVAAHSLPELAARAALVFQNPASQLFHLSVREEVAFGPRNLGLPETEVAARVAWALKAMGISHLHDAVPARLSGGQQQLVAIAAALALSPRALVLDEPTASLDGVHARLLLKTLHRLHNEQGVTILLIEHRFARALHFVDRALVMDGGRIVADGSPDAVLGRSDLRALGLRRMADHPPSPWRELIRPHGDVEPAGEPVLRMTDVRAGYGGRPVLRGVTLTLRAGEFAALVGDNGAGKSTLARVAAGLIKPQGGEMLVAGRRRPRPGLDVAMLFQNPIDQLFTDSVADEVAFGPHNFGREAEDQVGEALTQADLAHLRHRHPLSLSTGQQQRAALAACAALHPRLLILDEPTLGQDWRHMQALMAYLQRLNRAGVTILLISHDYKLIHHYARRVLLLHEGRIAVAGALTHQKEALL